MGTMGWTFTHKSKGQSIKDFFIKEFNGETELMKHTVIDCAVVNFHTAYIALQCERKAPESHEAKTYIMAIICLLEYRPHEYLNFGYKDMDEGMGPIADRCLERILKLLSPVGVAYPNLKGIGYEYAKDWRERCYRNLKK